MNRWQEIFLCIAFGFCAAESAEKESPPHSLAHLPGFDGYQRVRDASAILNGAGRVSHVEWADDGRSMNFVRGGKQIRLDLGDFSEKDLGNPPKFKLTLRPPARYHHVGRAQQSTWVTS
ncbi:MAG: hypothetical protein HOH86_05370, partial [Verrucomicrobiales bacterium]|nr:hypothetical protein [Verrucomicrobiales bacterium]